ncbi:MAG: DNA methylase [Anaerovoracaceae bacterium]
MNKYAVLANPGHNRVYFEASKKLAISELEIVFKGATNIKEEYIGGVFYITFEHDKELDIDNIETLSKLSFVYALFELVEDKLLKPIELVNYKYVNDNLSTILKYTGKTNELFTRMMINVALASSDTNAKGDVNLLDPIAGKGTTLFEGLIQGFNVYGVEIGDKVVNESYHFMKKYMEIEKYKHERKIDKITGKGKSLLGRRYAINIARTKEELRNKETRHFELISGNSINSDQFYQKNFFDIIVGDLPYGVQHGNVTREKQSSLTRNPVELINGCCSSWYKILKKGGVMVLSWNSFIVPHSELKKLLEDVGFRVLDEDRYSSFEHMVDKSIKRNIIVAKK